MPTINGTAGPDILDGTSGDDIINGLAGNDIINGALGADAMYGDTGDDTYYVDDVGDKVFEANGRGTDTVRSLLSFSLAGQYIENLFLTGFANTRATGNGLANLLVGNDGNNVLDGLAGADIMKGGLGDDVYYVDDAGDSVVELRDQGTDTVYAAIDFVIGSQYIENVVLIGTGSRSLTGNGLNNSLTGNSGNNLLNGATGADTMTGGLGNDTFVVDNAGDQVFEAASGGNDTVRASVSYSISGQDIETLVLLGAAVSATGNGLDNAIDGNAGNNIIDGGAGADRMRGGAGNDTYYVDNAGDKIIENQNAGNDTVMASVTFSIAGTYVENLTLTGNANINATGSGGDNVLRGNSGNNVLNGNVGADTMYGGAGNDTFYVDNSGDNVVEAPSEGIDTVQTTVNDYFLGSNLENLILAGTAVKGNGNGVDNVIAGNAVGNILNGWAGADTLAGGAGDDTYWVESAFDKVVEGAGNGNDTIISWITYFLPDNVESLFLTGDANIDGVGNNLDNRITGTLGNNRLNGGFGADTMIGARGNDSYFVDNTGDVVIENADEGIDTVTTYVDFTLGDNVEKLIMELNAVRGTGNNLGNTINGNNMGNLIDGGAGADTMFGAAGDDTYVVDDVNDRVLETAGNGNDTVWASVSFSLYAKAIENITLTGSANISATGNKQSNVLNGNDGDNYLDGGELSVYADTLNGGGGNDILVCAGAGTLSGGTGDDSYYIGYRMNNVIVEDADSGHDVVYTYGDYIVLGDNLEDLILTSASSLVYGNALDNHISGSSGFESLWGLDGNDVIDGGAGGDRIDGGNGNDFLQGGSGSDELYGGDGEDTLEGGDGDDYLVGGSAADTFQGGMGDDIYRVEDSSDVFTENAGEGNDTLIINASFDLTGSNFENLQLEGSDNLNATGDGGDNILSGNGGNNVIDGGAGADLMNGGGGNDTYYVDDAGDWITEASGGGNDIAYGSASVHADEAVETVILTGLADSDIKLNVPREPFVNNTLIGNDGANVIDGGLGNDILTGGGGADTFVFHTGTVTRYDYTFIGHVDPAEMHFQVRGQGTVTDFHADEGDRLDLTDWKNYSIQQSGANTVIHIDLPTAEDLHWDDPPRGTTSYDIVLLNVDSTSQAFLDSIIS